VDGSKVTFGKAWTIEAERKIKLDETATSAESDGICVIQADRGTSKC